MTNTRINIFISGLCIGLLAVCMIACGSVGNNNEANQVSGIGTVSSINWQHSYFIFRSDSGYIKIYAPLCLSNNGVGTSNYAPIPVWIGFRGKFGFRWTSSNMGNQSASQPWCYAIDWVQQVP